MSSVMAAVRLFLVFLFELSVANLSVVSLILFCSKKSIRSEIIDYPVEHLSFGQRLLLAQLITLTPGTVVCDWNGDSPWFRVHVLGRGKAELAADRIKQKLEKRVVEVVS